MSRVVDFSGVPAARMKLARQLRELADLIEADMAATEPHGIMMCLMGAKQYEVIGAGDTEGWRGARAAMHAVCGATFQTVGGNIRDRAHRTYQPREAAEVVPITASRKEGEA